MITGLYLLQKTQRTANEPGELLKPVSSRCHSGLRIMEAQAEGREQILPSRSSDQNTARPLRRAPVASGRLLLGPALDGCLEKTKRKEIQPQPPVAKVSYHWVWPWEKGRDKKEDRHMAVPESGGGCPGSQVHVRWPDWLSHLQLWGRAPDSWDPREPPSCTRSARCADGGADLLYLCFLHSWRHQLLGPPGPAWGPAPASSGACLLSSPDSCSRTPCPAGPAAETQPESSREGDCAEEGPSPRDGEHLVPGPSRLSPPWRCGQRGLPGIPGSQTNIPQEDGGDLLSRPTVTSLHTSKKDSKNLGSLDDAGAIPAGSVGQGSPACEQLVHIITGDYPVLLSTQQAWGNSPVASPAPTPWQTACHLRMALPGLGGCT